MKQFKSLLPPLHFRGENHVHVCKARICVCVALASVVILTGLASVLSEMGVFVLFLRHLQLRAVRVCGEMRLRPQLNAVNFRLTHFCRR